MSDRRFEADDRLPDPYAYLADRLEYPPRHKRPVVFRQTVADIPRFRSLQEALRPLTEGKQLAAKTEVMRAAMEFALMMETKEPGMLARCLSDMRLTPSREFPHPEERRMRDQIASIAKEVIDLGLG